jgi:plastocyanin
MTRTSIAAGFLAALLALAACSSSGSSSNSSAPPSQSSGGSAASTASGPTITIKNFGYSGTMTVKPGAKVTVVNDDSTAHTLTDKATKKFDTGNIDGNGAKGTFTAPTKAGSYPFGCTYHPNMKGTLVVQG